MSGVEVEIKGDWAIKRAPDFYLNCRMCGNHATHTIELGEVRDHYSSAEYDVCARPECRERALEKFAEHLIYIRTHRREISAQERWDMRDGK